MWFVLSGDGRLSLLSYGKGVLGAIMDSLESGLGGRGEMGRGAAGLGLHCSAAKSSTSSERTISMLGLFWGRPSQHRLKSISYSTAVPGTVFSRTPAMMLTANMTSCSWTSKGMTQLDNSQKMTPKL